MGSLRFSDFADSSTILLPPPNIHSFYASAHSHCIPHHQPVTQSTSRPPPAESSTPVLSSRKRSHDGDSADDVARSNPKTLRTSSGSTRHHAVLDRSESEADRSAEAKVPISDQNVAMKLVQRGQPKSSSTERDQDLDMMIVDAENIPPHTAEGKAEVAVLQVSSASDPFADQENPPTLENNPLDGIVTAQTSSQPADDAMENASHTGGISPFDHGSGSIAVNSDVTMS
ncbi:MAG: hypothetical protein Q9224_004646 [Gallowayella concinna]